MGGESLGSVVGGLARLWFGGVVWVVGGGEVILMIAKDFDHHYEQPGTVHT